MKTPSKTPAFTANRIAELTGLDRRTVSKRLRNIPPAHLESGREHWTLANVFAGANATPADITESQARRDLAIQRTALLKTQDEVLRRERIPLDLIDEVQTFVYGNMSAMLKQRVDKPFDEAVLRDLLAELRTIPDRLAEAFDKKP